MYTHIYLITTFLVLSLLIRKRDTATQEHTHPEILRRNPVDFCVSQEHTNMNLDMHTKFVNLT